MPLCWSHLKAGRDFDCFLNFRDCFSTPRFTQATQGVGFTFLSVLVLLLQFVLCFLLFVSLNTNNNCAFHSSQLLQYLSLTCIIRSLLTLKMHNAWLTFTSITDSKLFLPFLPVFAIKMPSYILRLICEQGVPVKNEKCGRIIKTMKDKRREAESFLSKESEIKGVEAPCCVDNCRLHLVCTKLLGKRFSKEILLKI